MNQYWLIAFLVWSAAMFGAGFEVESWHVGSKEAKLMAREDAAAKAAMKASSAIDTTFSESIAKLHQMEISANQSMEATHETPASPNCGLDPRRLSILRQAIAGDRPAR